jgi:hypothetical protein
MIIIDASSHFTKLIKPPDALPDLTDRLLRLTQNSRLSFGHWEIGEQHDTFVVLLRALRDGEVDEIFSDLRKACENFFGPKGPDLIIFPGDSTAIHLAGRFAEKFNCSPGLVTSPAFCERGKYELRLEISNNHPSLLRKKGRLDVLFFDDSLSSGETENHVLEAFIREVAGVYRKNLSSTRWMTYTVLLRQQLGQKQVLEIKRETPPPAQQQLMDYRYCAFGVIGPESLNRANCPLCRASQRVRQAASWGKGARLSVREILERLDNSLEARPIERLVSPLSFLQTEIASELLRLEALQMPEACVYLWKHFIKPTQPALSVEVSLAGLVFIALHYDDAASYLSWNDIICFINKTLENKSINDFTDVFLIALLIFPTSILKEVTLSVVSHFARSGDVDFVAAVMALAFASQYHVLHEIVSREAASHREKIYFKRRTDLIENIKAMLNPSSSRRQDDLAAVREIVTADLSIVAFQPRQDSPAWLARTLSALLQRGQHPSFLSEQINNLSANTVINIRNSLLQALELMRRLPPSVIADLEDRIDVLMKDLRECHQQDVGQCRNIAEIIISELWEETINSKFSLPPITLQDYVRKCITAPKETYPASQIGMEHLLILECIGTNLDCEAFGPGRTTLMSHIRNLLVNPFKHYPIEAFNLNPGNIPLVVIYVRLDEPQERLLLAVADRSKSPQTHNMWTLTRGLANFRATMQIFGGDVEYHEMKTSFLSHACSPTAEQQKQFATYALDPSVYKNLFVTSFPITRQKL